jgi:hypothetical protein
LHLEEHVAAGSHWWVKSAALLQVGFKERVNTFGKEFTVEERNLLSFANKNTTFFYMKIEVKLAHTCGILDLFDCHHNSLKPVDEVWSFPW